MAIGLYAFRDIRIAKEAGGGAGTKIDTATQRLLGTLTFPMGGVILHRPEDERGHMQNRRRTLKVGEELTLIFEGDLLTDQFMYPCQMGLKEISTPEGGSAPYTWNFQPSTTSQNTPSSYTFQFGDNLAVYDVAYVTCRQIQVIGAMNEPCKIRIEYFGQNFEVGTFNPTQGNTTIDPASTETCLTNKTKLYITTTGSAPTTEKSSTLLGFTWTYDTGYRPVIHGSSNLYFDKIIQRPPRVTCEITAEFNTGMEAERVIYQAGTGRTFKLQIGASGTDRVDLVWGGVYTSWEPLSQEDGLEVVRFTTEDQYDAGVPLPCQILVVNSIAAMV